MVPQIADSGTKNLHIFSFTVRKITHQEGEFPWFCVQSISSKCRKGYYYAGKDIILELFLPNSRSCTANLQQKHKTISSFDKSRSLLHSMMAVFFRLFRLPRPLEIRKHQVKKNYLSLKTNNPKTLELASFTYQ